MRAPAKNWPIVVSDIISDPFFNYIQYVDGFYYYYYYC